MELMIATGIGNEGLGFLFDRGKATGISYDTSDNISCSLSFKISKAMGFVFDRGKVEVTIKMREYPTIHRITFLVHYRLRSLRLWVLFSIVGRSK
ncbi:hypothetical protein MKW98_030456 [Papaver atlanticum]|uniref:Uncharacterized protein n=1 Tax=Papaver atlanticum TaxID=357466 RepID=A0AAD4SRC8_9MAGN|nr:hypothetical protein MKW98_030456 [Papaver atlanticum]